MYPWSIFTPSVLFGVFRLTHRPLGVIGRWLVGYVRMATTDGNRKLCPRTKVRGAFTITRGNLHIRSSPPLLLLVTVLRSEPAAAGVSAHTQVRRSAASACGSVRVLLRIGVSPRLCSEMLWGWMMVGWRWMEVDGGNTCCHGELKMRQGADEALRLQTSFHTGMLLWLHALGVGDHGWCHRHQRLHRFLYCP